MRLPGQRKKSHVPQIGKETLVSIIINAFLATSFIALLMTEAMIQPTHPTIAKYPARHTCQALPTLTPMG